MLAHQKSLGKDQQAIKFFCIMASPEVVLCVTLLLLYTSNLAAELRHFYSTPATWLLNYHTELKCQFMFMTWHYGK